MREVILFDSVEHRSLLPLTYLRAVSQCRIGLLTIQEKWNHLLAESISIKTEAYLQDLYDPIPTNSTSKLWINGAVLPNTALIEKINALKSNEVLVDGSAIIAYQNDVMLSAESINDNKHNLIDIPSDRIVHPEDILNYCDQEFRKDFELVTKDNESARPEHHVRCRGENIFIHPSAKVYDCILNATEGPIYIGPEVEVMEQAVIKGPVGIGANSTIHVGAKVYAHTMLGPYSKIGGEIKRTTIFGFSNKAHDGYLGDSVIGEWCNLGADTNNSNMKNTYGMVSLWSPATKEYRITDRQFLGLIMGDHTMSAINTAFMTGSVTGVFANIFGGSYPSRWSPSFSWGSLDQRYDLDRAYTVAQRKMMRRGIELSDAYQKALRHISAL